MKFLGRFYSEEKRETLRRTRRRKRIEGILHSRRWMEKHADILALRYDLQMRDCPDATESGTTILKGTLLRVHKSPLGYQLMLANPKNERERALEARIQNPAYFCRPSPLIALAACSK